MQSLRRMRLIYAVASSLAGTLTIAVPALAETGTLGNILDIPVTYQAGIPDANGYVDWQVHTLHPCETHEWSWDRGGQPNIHFIWPRWRDERKDEYGNVVMDRNVIPMSDTGALAVFFPLGEQIWIDMSGAATMDACTAPPSPPTPPAPPPEEELSMGGQVDISDIDDLIARAERGEILLIDINAFAGLTSWEGPRIIPVTLEDFAILVFLAATIEDPDRANAHMADLIRSMTLQSKALIEVLRADRNKIATKN
jgi:hypothetical protein